VRLVVDARRRHGPLRSGATVAVVVGLSAWLLVRLLEPMRLFADDWNFLLTRHEWSLHSLLRDHAGHPVIVPALSYMVGFNVFGLGAMWYFKAVLISMHLGVCAAVSCRVWRKHGTVAAMAAWAIVCFMGAGAQDIVHFFQIAFLGSVLFFLLALDPLENILRSGRRRDVLVLAVLLTGSVASSTVGVAAVLVCGLVLMVERAGRRHLWAVAVPVVLYLVWRSRFGSSTETSIDLGVMVRFLWASIRDAGAAIALGNEFVGVILVGSLTLLAIRALRSRQSPHLLAGLLFTGAFWGLTAISRAETQDRLNDLAPSRYTYVAVVGLMVALCDLTPPVGSERRRTFAAGIAAVAVAIGSVWAGHAELISTRNHFAFWGRYSAATLAVVDAHPESVPKDVPFDPLFFFTRITVGDYLRISRSLGSGGGLTPREFSEASGDVLDGAEELIPPLLEVLPAESELCSTIGTGIREVDLDGGESIRIDTDADVSLTVSRWRPSNPRGPDVRALQPGRWRLAAPADSLPGPWRLSFSGQVQRLDCS